MNLRENNLQKMRQQEFDVLILGGGINGAVSASALATRGASVALIEKGDFACGTSQESSNLVWGGIKYLETREFALVRKLCTCRNDLLRAYPSSVKEVRFFTTIERGFRFNRFILWLGTLLYWMIGSFFTVMPRLLSRADINAGEPAVETDQAAGGFEYSDAYLPDNDARFVFNFIRDALDHGGIVANYVAYESSRREGDRWLTRARDVKTGEEFTIRSKVVINACGPWVDEVNGIGGMRTRHRHVFSRGIHLVVGRITHSGRVLTFFADDGRLFFIIPMGPRSCIGTTDTRVEKLPAEVTPEDRRFVLDNINKRLRLDRPLEESDIIAERCGVRPLVVEGRSSGESSDWTALSRKHVIEPDHGQHWLSVFGGKLTDCLNVGDEVCDLVRHWGIEMPWYQRHWFGEPVADVREIFMHQARSIRLDDMTSPDSSEPLSQRLWRRYEASALHLLELIRQDPAMAEVLIGGAEYIRCELVHAARREMIVDLEDFLRRRSKIALIADRETLRGAPGLMEACHILFGSDAEKKFAEYFDGASPAATTGQQHGGGR